MKRKSLRKLLSMSLVASTLLGLTACGGQVEKETEKEVAFATETEVVGEETEEITFPLEEEITFNIVTQGDGTKIELLEKCQLWQDLYEMTNVKVNWINIDYDQMAALLPAMYGAGEEPDAVWHGASVNSDGVTSMAAQGFFMPLNEYIDDASIMPNFNSRVLEESPGTKGLITLPDGNIYSLPIYDALQGDYLESPIWINKTWLDKLGLPIPTTMEDLEVVLTAFSENDMTGNGNTEDEIPYFIKNSHSFAHIEAFMGHWGLATKNGKYENFVSVKNGNVEFVPVSDTYKDIIKVLNRWYENGLIWGECFTASSDTVAAKLASEVPLVGMLTSKTPPGNNYNDYVCIDPVKVEGYEPCWYYHPGIMGVTGMISISSSCENAEVLMKWLDLFYNFEISTRVRFGEEADGRYKIVDGKVQLITLDQATLDSLAETAPTLQDCTIVRIYAYTAEDYNERLLLSTEQEAKMENYKKYQSVINKEVWPRPYFKAEDANRVGELRTDIFNTVEECKAAWITGARDIEAEWDSYVKSLEKMGLEEFIDIYQERYDIYLEAQK